MIANYWKLIYRNFLSNKVFSIINILGLSLGMSVCILILEFVNFEFSYDFFHANGSDIYRVTNDRFQNNELIQHGTITYPTIGPAMSKDYPEVINYTRMMSMGRTSVMVGEEIYGENNNFFADNNFLTLFSFPLIAGDRQNALEEVNTVVLSRTLANKYFGEDQVDYNQLIGKTITIGQDPFQITAIFENIPVNSHIRFNMLISYETLIRNSDGRADNSFQNSNYWHYLQLQPGTDPQQLVAKFDGFSDRYFDGNNVSGSVEKFDLQPLKNAHLYSDYEYEIGEVTNGKMVWASLAIALLVLAMAWVNYVNLTTSKSLERAKEVGLRKVNGASRLQLIKQFVGESIAINLISLLLAITLVELLQGYLNEVLQLELSIGALLSDSFHFIPTIYFLIVALGVGILLSGLYPAIVLSSYQPSEVLKGKFQRSASGKNIRKVLVIFQFIASIILISCTYVVYEQIKYIETKDLGIAINNTLVVRGPGLTSFDSTFISRADAFKSALKQNPAIFHASTSGRIAGNRLGRAFDVKRKNGNTDKQYTISLMFADHDFIDFYGIPLVAGRKFTRSDHNTDFRQLNTVLINENAVKLFGFNSPEEAVNQHITTMGNEWRIIGITKDFHQESLHNPKEPILFIPAYDNGNYISIKIADQGMKKTIGFVETTFHQHFTGNNFDYFFLDDQYQQQYESDHRFSSIMNNFTWLAIFIACLGLFGLSSYTVTQRNKEIGIRKVLGANVIGIVNTLTIDFIKPIIISSIIAVPIAYYCTIRWLHDFAYPVKVYWWYFLLPIVAIALIALLTICGQIIKAATANPIKALRNE